MKAAFANALASGVEDPFSVIVSGAGQAVSQSGGNLLITTGTTANAANVCFTFPTPIKGTANTLIEIACGTTSSATFANLTGYVAP